jgi:hypothetical protein
MQSPQRRFPDQVLLFQQRAYFPISGSERTIYLSVGSVDLAVSIFNVAVLVGVRALKEPPSDILLMLTVYSIVKTGLIYTTLSSSDYSQFTTTPIPPIIHQDSATFVLPLDS